MIFTTNAWRPPSEGEREAIARIRQYLTNHGFKPIAAHDPGAHQDAPAAAPVVTSEEALARDALPESLRASASFRPAMRAAGAWPLQGGGCTVQMALRGYIELSWFHSQMGNELAEPTDKSRRMWIKRAFYSRDALVYRLLHRAHAAAQLRPVVRADGKAVGSVTPGRAAETAVTLFRKCLRDQFQSDECRGVWDRVPPSVPCHFLLGDVGGPAELRKACDSTGNVVSTTIEASDAGPASLLRLCARLAE